MDPVSALGVGVVSFEILECVGKILGFLLKISTKFKHANTKVQLLIGFLSSLQISIKEITVIADGLAYREDYKEVIEGLRMTMECTKIAVSLLESKLDGLQSDSTDMKSKIEKLMVVLRGDEFGEWSSDIGHLVDALNLSLNALQSRTLLERQGILSSPEAQEIMHIVKSRTSSMIWIERRKSTDSQLSTFSEASANIDVAFSFDQQLMGSNIYQVAQRSHLRHALAAERNRETKINNVLGSAQSLANDRSDAPDTSHATHTIRKKYHSDSAVSTEGADSAPKIADTRTEAALKSDSQNQRQPDSEMRSSHSDSDIVEHSPASPNIAEADKLPHQILRTSHRTATEKLPSSSSATSTASGGIFKAFRVADDPTHKILPIALKKHGIQADWRQFALHIVYDDMERYIELDERPFRIFNQLKEEGKKPTFVLRKNTPPSQKDKSSRALQLPIQLPGGVI